MLVSTRPAARRRGAAAVEAAIVIPVFLLLVLGVIDLGLAVARYNTLSQAARYGARKMTVHGKLSPIDTSTDPDWQTAWGPTAVDEPATATGVREVNAVTPMLVNCPASQTRVKVDWLDGANAVGDRVRVTVTSDYQPLTTYIFGGATFTLSASSTMLISH